LLDVGIYVDNNGKRSRPLELMWPAPPTAASESTYGAFIYRLHYLIMNYNRVELRLHQATLQ